MAKDPTSEFSSDSATEAAGGTDATPPPPDRDSFFGQPRGLATLFFTEMWERFSYYGMRGILILFMVAPVATGGLGFDTLKAGAIYGLYTGFVYMMTLPGGWIADNVLGQRRAVLVGGIIIALGHFSMAVQTLSSFYAGLGLIVIGTGLLKPNISTMVGELYPEGGSRRDAGFSIFYMGINLGALIAPFIVGSLGEKVNWHLGFAAAGVGMVLGLIQYVWGGKYLGEAGLFPDTAGEPGARARAIRNLLLGIGAVVVLAVVFWLLQAGGVVDITLTTVARAMSVVILTIVVLYFGYLFLSGGAEGLDRTEKKRLGAIFILFLAAAIFWMGFEQAGSSLTLVAERGTDLLFGGWLMPASWFQSFNPLFIILLAPVFAWLWITLGNRGSEPSIPMKFGVGLVLMSLGFAVMAYAMWQAGQGEMISPAWLIVTYLLHTTGELSLSPVGLSAVTKLAPHRMVGQMMGVWFMASALGNLVAGQVAGFYDLLPVWQLFGLVFLTSAAAGLLMAAFSKPIRGLMGGVR